MTTTAQHQVPENRQKTDIRVDIISDVVCPWCVIGYLQLQKAAGFLHADLDISWHPFELNPTMPVGGQHLGEHMTGKYRLDARQIEQNRQRLRELGHELGFEFCYSSESRIFNTLQAHSLAYWAAGIGKQNELMQQFFHAYFTEQRNIDDKDELLEIVHLLKLDIHEADTALRSKPIKEAVREREAHWQSSGINGVPAMVFSQRFLVSGAQGIDSYRNIISKLMQEAGESYAQ